VNAPHAQSPQKTAAITGGTAGAVTAVPLPERRDHEEGEHLELEGLRRGGGADSALSPFRSIRWSV
jgi:hypothetical protein